jgi:hypothetical protein
MADFLASLLIGIFLVPFTLMRMSCRKLKGSLLTRAQADSVIWSCYGPTVALP